MPRYLHIWLRYRIQYYPIISSISTMHINLGLIVGISPTFMKYRMITVCQDTYKYQSHSYAHIIPVFLFFHPTVFFGATVSDLDFHHPSPKILSIWQLWLFSVRPSSAKKKRSCWKICL